VGKDKANFGSASNQLHSTQFPLYAAHGDWLPSGLNIIAGTNIEQRKQGSIYSLVCEDTNHGDGKQSERTERERCRIDGL
jgi:hypothetical protein